MYIAQLPNLEYLKECFEIDPSSPSGLRWAANRPLHHFKNEAVRKRWSTNNGNKPSGGILTNGYYHSRLDSKRYPTHRIIFAIHNNTIDFQGKQIDHIDGNPLNNSPQNLRLVTASQNQFNRKKQKNNTSGHKNIYFHKRCQKYTCSIRINNKQTHIGIFDSLELAIEARDKKLKEVTGEFFKA